MCARFNGLWSFRYSSVTCLWNAVGKKADFRHKCLFRNQSVIAHSWQEIGRKIRCVFCCFQFCYCLQQRVSIGTTSVVHLLNLVAYYSVPTGQQWTENMNILVLCLWRCTEQPHNPSVTDKGQEHSTWFSIGKLFLSKLIISLQFGLMETHQLGTSLHALNQLRKISNGTNSGNVDCRVHTVEDRVRSTHTWTMTVFSSFFLPRYHSEFEIKQ